MKDRIYKIDISTLRKPMKQSQAERIDNLGKMLDELQAYLQKANWIADTIANELKELQKGASEAPKQKEFLNRWHTGVLPEPMNLATPCSHNVLVEIEYGSTDIAYFDHEERGWFKDHDEPIYGVVAWCEIPKRIKR